MNGNRQTNKQTGRTDRQTDKNKTKQNKKITSKISVYSTVVLSLLYFNIIFTTECILIEEFPGSGPLTSLTAWDNGG